MIIVNKLCDLSPQSNDIKLIKYEKKKITMEILMMRTNLSQKIDQLIASLKTYKIYNWLGWIQAWM